MLPYSERLKALNLTTLAERRIRGDLIQTFKIVNKSVNYGENLFKLGRSGRNIVRKVTLSNNISIKSMVNAFMPNRVISYWNKLPSNVKNSTTVNNFKINLENYKMKHFNYSTGYFWEVSTQVLKRIEGVNYFQNKLKQNEYLSFHPEVAKSKGINLRVSTNI